MTVDKPLRGWRVLVPRGGPWGHGVAADLRARGASPVVAPMINFAGAADPVPLEHALRRLAAGAFDWMTVTSATTVDVLSAHGAVVPSTTRVGAVGETTAAALVAAGYRVDFTPVRDNSAAGMLDEWPSATGATVPQRILALRSEIAKPVLTDGLRAMGHDVEAVIAYRTIGVPVDPAIRDDVAGGRVDAILITSGSVAEQVAAQFGPIPVTTVVACIGPRTAADAELAGLRVDVVARERTSASLIGIVEDLASSRPPASGSREPA